MERLVDSYRYADKNVRLFADDVIQSPTTPHCCGIVVYQVYVDGKRVLDVEFGSPTVDLLRDKIKRWIDKSA